MTVREIHNTVRSMLGHVASARDRSWESGEIDSAYNRVASQFIATRIAFYAKGEIQSIEDLQNLVEIDWKSQATQLEDTVYQARLASNHLGILSISAIGAWDCTGTVKQGTPTAVTEYRIQLINSTKAAAPFYQTVVLNNGTAFSSLTSERTLAYDNLDIYEHLKWFAGQKNIYTRGNALVGYGPFNVLVDGITFVRTTSTATVKLMEMTGTRLRSTIISPVQLSDRLGTPYFGPHKDHVLIVPGKDSNLTFYTAAGCTVSYAAITYVRKPQPISLILGSETDLTDNGKVHELLCKMTVTDLMGDAADDRYIMSLQQQIRNFDNRPA